MSYKDQTNDNFDRRTDKLLSSLPAFMTSYSNYLKLDISQSTRYGYVRDLKDFLEYLSQVKEISIMDITPATLDDLSIEDIKDYMNYVSKYEKDGKIRKNQNVSIRRKLSSIKSLYNTLFIQDKIKNNLSAKIKTPKITDKEIIRMDNEEVHTLLNTVEYGEKLTKKQEDYHTIYGYRDFTIITLLLSTGIRISECVGLNLKDVDLKNHKIRVIRKGGSEGIVYFSDSCTGILDDYINIYRTPIVALPGHEDALFLSSQKRRMTERSIQYMVKKYVDNAKLLKHITPHKFRSTFGTMLYNVTKDAYLCSSALGHKSLETAKRHYIVPLDQASKRNSVDIH